VDGFLQGGKNTTIPVRSSHSSLLTPHLHLPSPISIPLTSIRRPRAQARWTKLVTPSRVLLLLALNVCTTKRRCEWMRRRDHRQPPMCLHRPTPVPPVPHLQAAPESGDRIPEISLCSTRSRDLKLQRLSEGHREFTPLFPLSHRLAVFSNSCRSSSSS
jgi:hypothetical protein